MNLYVKVEAFNPLGSVKDRLALGVIEEAERTGKLKPGQTVVEATSGNTGIGLAMVCAAKGYPLVVTMAETFSIERRKLMRFLGAKVVITPAAARAVGMVKKTIELAEKHGWYYTRQFENEANADMHSRTTAQEILRDFEDERLDYWVTGFGTGGTLKGVARVWQRSGRRPRSWSASRTMRPCFRAGSSRSATRTDRRSAAHPSWKPHPMQGWSPDFIAKLTGDAVSSKAISQVLRITNADAMRCSKELAKKEGIFVGITSGGTFAGALQVAAAGAQRDRRSSACCPIPASAISALPCSPMCRRT